VVMVWLSQKVHVGRRWRCGDGMAQSEGTMGSRLGCGDGMAQSEGTRGQKVRLW
jgi:hypothetical protein